MRAAIHRNRSICQKDPNWDQGKWSDRGRVHAGTGQANRVARQSAGSSWPHDVAGARQQFVRHLIRAQAVHASDVSSGWPGRWPC